MSNTPWWMYAVGSAICAAAIPILGKVGLRSVHPEVATVVRSAVTTVVLVLFATGMNLWSSLPTFRGEGAKGIVCIGVAGLAGALSWILYFKALATEEASRVAPLDKLSVPIAIVLAALVLGERPSVVNWIGVAVAAVGILLATHR